MTKFFALFGYAIIFSLVAFAQQTPSLERLKSNAAVKHDESNPFVADKPLIKPAGAAVEQTLLGSKTVIVLTSSFEGLGESFVGPQGTATLRNPSDNSLAVGLDHIVQIVNARMAIFSKKGKTFSESGTPLYGPVETRNVFRGFGGT